MLASLIWTIGGLAAGGGGLWISALFVPTVASLLKAALDFLRSPLGTALGMLGLAVILHVAGYVAGDMHGSNAVRAEWRADVAEKAKAAALREAAVRLEMRNTIGGALADDQLFTKSIDGKVKSYVAETPSGAVCRVTGADVGRLLSVR